MPPYNVKIKVNEDSHIMVGGQRLKETGWIAGTHAFEATLTGVAAGNGASAGANTIKVTCSVSHIEDDELSVPQVTITIE